MKCSVRNCDNECKDKASNKSFFTFPRNEKLQKKWIAFCKQTKLFNAKTWKICSDHFDPKDICGDRKYEMGFGVRRKLRPGAFPCRMAENTKKTERAKRVQRKENKKIVSALLSEDSNDSNQLETIGGASNAKILVSNEIRPIPTPISLPLLEQNSDNSVVNELDHVKFQVKMLTKEIKLLKRENESLKDEITLKSKEFENSMDQQKKKLEKAMFELQNVEEKLKEIFTDGQIRKLKNGEKRQNWSLFDIANSITLYSASAKGYKLLKKKKFPLPAVRTLQHWAQKLNIQPGLLQPVLKIMSDN